MGSQGVHFESPIAMDLVMMSSRLCAWYSKEREDASPVMPAQKVGPFHQMHPQFHVMSSRMQSQQQQQQSLGAFSSRAYRYPPVHYGGM